MTFVRKYPDWHELAPGDLAVVPGVGSRRALMNELARYRRECADLMVRPKRLHATYSAKSRAAYVVHLPRGVDAPEPPPRPALYPWARLAVGQSERVERVPSPAAMRVSLHTFRRRLLHEGLSTKDAQPQFQVEHDTQAGAATVTRLPDGPVLIGAPAWTSAAGLAKRRKAQLRDNQREAAFAILSALDAHLEAKGNGRATMVPLDLVERAVEHDRLYGTRLAHQLAAADFPSAEPDQEGPKLKQRRRATDKPNTPIPPRAVDPDGPANDYLAQRLKQACNTSVS